MLDVVLVGPFPEQPSLIRGGVQASVYGLARALARRRDVGRILVIAPPLQAAPRAGVATAVIDGLEVTWLDVPGTLRASTVVHLPRALRIIRRLDRPVVHVHGTGPFEAALLAVLRLRRIPCVWTLHGITEKETWQRYRAHRTVANYLRHRLYRSLERFALRIAPVTICDTPYVRDALPAARRGLHVIPQGIFLEEFSGPIPAPLDREPLVLSLGVLTPRKGHHLTLEAFARVRDRLPEARLIIAGARTDPAYHRRLRDVAAGLGLADAVAIRPDLPRAEVLALLGRARVVALHSQEESQGIALCEALAAGVPVVATRVGGIPDVVEDGRTGLLVPYGDVPRFAEAIRLLLADEPRRAAMAARAKDAGARFDWTHVAGEVLQVYDASRPAADPAPGAAGIAARGGE